MTRTTPFGYVVPLPTDPVRDGADMIAGIGDNLRPADLFPGQPPWAGSAAYTRAKVRHVCINNWQVGLDGFGMATAPSGFTTVLVTATLFIASIRDLGRSVLFNNESLAVNGVSFMVLDARGEQCRNQWQHLNVSMWGY